MSKLEVAFACVRPFTPEGLKHLDKLTELNERSISSPALRESMDPEQVLKLLGTWEYVSVTYDGKPIEFGNKETITLSNDSWALRRDGDLITRSTWTVDSTKNPKWLTQTTHGGKVNFRGSLGVQV